MRLSIGLSILVLSLAYCSARPVGESGSTEAKSCGSNPTCTLQAKAKFSYEPGKAYAYEVKSTINTAAVNPSSKKAGFEVGAIATIEVLAPCELQLKLADVRIKDESGNVISDRNFVTSLSLPLRFEWNDGRINELCPSSETDSQWSLNFKRSVLSALQNAMDSLDNPEPIRQVDAAGDCWTNYETVSSTLNKKVISWTKDLNQCADRHGGLTALFGVRYSNPLSDINTLPLTNGKQVCTQTTEDKIIRLVDCNERLEFLPTRLQEGGVTVVSVATMQLKLNSIFDRKAVASPIAYSTDIKFDHSYVPANIDGDAKDAEQLLQKMCKDDGVVTESGRELSDLVDSLRSLSKEEIAEVYDSAAECKATRRIMQSVIPDIGTAESGRFIVERVGLGEDPVSSLVREDWMASLRVVRSPSAELLHPAAVVVTSNREFAVSGRAYLGVGSAIHNFCFQHNDCASWDEVKAAVNKLTDQLGLCKPTSGPFSASEESVRKAVYSLRALGNAGPALNSNAASAITQCMINKALPAEIRLSALSTMRRVPCAEETLAVSETFRTMVYDFSEDSEVRAVAFLAAMRCPSLDDLALIRSIITDNSRKVSEKLGAFIVSYLDRLNDPPFSSYWSAEVTSTISALLKTRPAIELLQKIDAMKRGASYHYHQFFSRINTGYMFDFDVLHSEKSIMPRQLLFNLSVALFGRTVNPIELGMRQEGLESVIDDSPDEPAEVPSSNSQELSLPRLDAAKLRPVLEKLKLSFFVRLFGDEVRYAEIDKSVIDRLRTRLGENINTEMFASEEGRQASDLFFDRALSLPTCAGLPLRLSLRGTYRSQVRPNLHPEFKYNGDGKIASISIKANVKAGLAVELRSSMAAYLGGRQYGLQAVTRLNSKAEYKPQFLYQGRHVKLNVDLPTKVIRAASVSNEVFVRRDKFEEPVVVDSALRVSQICTPASIGLKICVTSSIPSRWNGLMTQGQMSMTLEKVDESIDAVNFEFLAEHNTNSEGQIDSIDFKASLDTPGSNFDRKLLAALKISRPQGSFNAILETPWKKGELNLAMTGNNSHNEIAASLTIGDLNKRQSRYEVLVRRTLSSITEGDKSYPKRSLSVEVTNSDIDQPIFKASGSLTDMNTLKEIAINIVALHIPNVYTLSRPLAIIGDIGMHPTRGYGFMIRGQGPSRDFETEFGIKLEPAGSQTIYSHRLHYQSSETNSGKADSAVVWEVQFLREPSRKFILKSVLNAFNVLYVDQANHRLDVNIERPTAEDYIGLFELDIGVDKAVKRFKGLQKISRIVMPTRHGFKYLLVLSAPEMVDHSISIDYLREWEPNTVISFEAEHRRGDVAQYHVVLSGRRDAPGFGEFKLRTFCPLADFLLSGKAVEVDDFTKKHSFRFERNGDLRIGFESEVRVDDESHAVEANIALFGMPSITLSSRGSGTLSNGIWAHDGVLAYGSRKLMFGGNVNYEAKGDRNFALDTNFYVGSLERMFKAYANCKHVNDMAKLRGMVELGDDMYHFSGEFDLASRNHYLLLEGPRSSTDFQLKLSNGGVESAFNHQCPNVTLRMFGKASLSKLRSDLVSYVSYKRPQDKAEKRIGFNLGYKADTTEGLDLGFLSSIKVNDREWFANSNFTVIPGKVELSAGAGDGNAVRHKATLLISRRWLSENALLINSQAEFHSTSLEIPKLKAEVYKRLTWKIETGRLGDYDTSMRIVRGNNEIRCAFHLDAMSPREAMTITFSALSPWTELGEVKFQYSANLPSITFSTSARYGLRAGRVLGLIEVNKLERNGIDLMYSVAAYSAANEHAEVSIRGQHSGDFNSNGQSFIAAEIRDSVYAVHTRWNIEEPKLVEIVVKTPIEEYFENILRVSLSGMQDTNDTLGEVLLTIGKRNFRSTAWLKLLPDSHQGEFKVDIDKGIYALGFVYDHPEEMMTLGEHRLRLRLDTPVEGYRTSTILFWINPFSDGLSGIATVLGLDQTEASSLVQRGQFQIAYHIGDQQKGSISFSARGERDSDPVAWRFLRQVSCVVQLPFSNFSVELKSVYIPDKSYGFGEVIFPSIGSWQADWSLTGGLKKAGEINVLIHGTPVDMAGNEPITIRLSGSHDFADPWNIKGVNGLISTNIPGYSSIRIRVTQSMDDESGDIVLAFEARLPDKQSIHTRIAFGVVPPDFFEMSFKLTTPYESLSYLGFNVTLQNVENPPAFVNIAFQRNNFPYNFSLNYDYNDESLNGSMTLTTAFEGFELISGDFYQSGSWSSGWKTRANFKASNGWEALIESQHGDDASNQLLSAVITIDDVKAYMITLEKEPAKFEVRLPIPWASCTIHYDGEISTDESVFFAVRRHHTCLPYTWFSGNATLSLSEAKQLLLHLESPIPYFQSFFTNFTYEFDDSIYMIEERLPPIGVYLLIQRETMKEMDLKFRLLPDEQAAKLDWSIRSIILTADAVIGGDEQGHLNAELITPVITITMTTKREGPWANPTNIEAVLSGFGFDLYNVYGKWNFESFPESYSINLEGTVLSKVAEIKATGSIANLRKWNHEVEGRFANRRLKLGSVMDGNKISINYEQPARQSLKIIAVVDPVDNGVSKSLSSSFEVTQKGLFSLFQSANWTSSCSVPSSVNFLSLNDNFLENLKIIIQTIVSNVEWRKRLVIDGVEKYLTATKLQVIMPKSQDLGGLRIDYESSRAWNANNYHVKLVAVKTEQSPSADLKIELDVNGAKLLDVTGTVEKHQSFLKYAQVKLDFEAPKQMSFDIIRNGTNSMHRVWKAIVVLDKVADPEGTVWQLDVKPTDPSRSSGIELKLQTTRQGNEMLMLETGYERSLANPLFLEFHLFGKTANMPKKYGFKQHVSVTGTVLHVKVWFSSLTRDIKVDMDGGFETDPTRIFINLDHDLGDPTKKLEAKIEWQGDIVKGNVKCGDKVVDFRGSMNISDRNNYGLTVDVRDNEQNTAEFVLTNNWNEKTRNRTLHATLKTNNGYIEWTSHRYIADPIRSRGVLVRYHRQDWPEGIETVLYAYGEVDFAGPALTFHLLTPFRTADYSIRTEHRDNGVQEFKARLIGDAGRLSSINLELDPTQPSFDLSSLHPDGIRFKLHGHVVSTQHAFLEAKRMMSEDSGYEKLARISLNVDHSVFNASFNYYPQLIEIFKTYFTDRRNDITDVIKRYRVHIPEGFHSLRHIKLLDELVMPFIYTLNNDSQQLSENERSEWRLITTKWFSSDAVKEMFGAGVQSYATDVINRWLSQPEAETAENEKTSFSPPDKAFFAMGEAIRSFYRDDLWSAWPTLRVSEANELTESHNTIRSALLDLGYSTRDYVAEAVERVADQTWSSCFYRYLRAVPERISEKLEMFEQHDEYRRIRDKFKATMTKMWQLAGEARKYLFAPPSPAANLARPNPLFAGLRDMITNSSFAFNPSKGTLEASIILPSRELGSLRAPVALARWIGDSRYLLERGISAVQSRVANHGPMSQLTLQRFYGAVQYYRAGELKILPPLSAQALIVGSSHGTNDARIRRDASNSNEVPVAENETAVDIVTFDGVGISLAAPESTEQRRLVLLYDRVRLTPRLIITIRKDSKWSVTCLVDERSIEIRPWEQHVYIGGSQAELPFQFTSTRVRRIGPEIQLQSRLGFELVCNVEYFYCRIVIDGVRYGTQAGVLGTYTGNIADDLMSADGQRLADNKLKDFLCSWQLESAASGCSSLTKDGLTTGVRPDSSDESRSNEGDDGADYSWLNSEAIYEDVATGASAAVYKNVEAKSLCKKLFQSRQSAMAACFDYVKPAPFFHACVGRVVEFQAACGVAFAYSAHCRHTGVHVRPPKSCVRCKPTSAALSVLSGKLHPQAVQIPVLSADVVFVVDESSLCSRTNLSSMISSFAENIDRQFDKINITENRFSIIGYGGQGAHKEVHFQTLAGGNLWVNVEELSANLGKSIHQAAKSSRQGHSKGDALAAIHLGVNSPWRIGAKRIMVMVSCSKIACLEDAISLESLKAYFEINRIVMHFVGPTILSSLNLPSKNEAAHVLMGFDSRNLFTDKTLPEGSSSSEMWRAFTDRPDDACSRLAVSMMGSYWSLEKATLMPDTVSLSLASRVANIYSKSGSNKPDCTQCACTLADYAVTGTYYDPEAVADCYRCHGY